MNYSRTVILVLGTAIVVAAAIYLTPLKWVNVVGPNMREMDPAAFNAALTASPDNYLFIDVRSTDVYTNAHAEGAMNIPIAYLYNQHSTLPRSGKQIALICTNGVLAAVAYGYLQYLGFTNLIHITGGLQSWATEGLPTEGKGVFSTSTPPDQN